MKASEPVANVIHLTFPSQRLLASTMLRYQETYESPKYRNKPFTLEEFKAWYKTTKPHGRFTYYKDWDGFNIPSRILRRFDKGEFDPLDPNEKALLVLLRGGKDRFYLIATSGRDVDKAVLRHEVAHGLWYTRPDYRRRAKALLKTVDLAPVYAMLERLGYHRSVWLDEAHAWIGDGARAARRRPARPAALPRGEEEASGAAKRIRFRGF
ncbi:MAG: ABC transporter ATP-binding protein [Elusimicrobiota bacterium]|nr:MAG: ABC transporter ATP-binding protein [Elusimicrobiota bacterium]